MSRALLLSLLIGLSLFGIADSWYLYQSAVSSTALICDLGAALDGCNVVAQSEYSRFLGYPLALYGVGFFGLVFVLAALAWVRPVPRLWTFVLALTGLGSLASLGFLYIQFFLIKALCIYCILSALAVFLACAVAYLLWRRERVSVAS